MIELYTDGAALGNPGPGGYGFILIFKDKKKEVSAGYRLTTNNRMELLAVIEGLKALKILDIPIKIYSDSRYVIDSITLKWVDKWVKTNFKDKKNADLWKEFLKISKPFKHIEYFWVKGHADNVFNNQCDILATQAASRQAHLIDTYYELLKNNS
ncbi:MAG: ribonuclease HI [Alphaproteobacteria bacterium]|nr:ribonuclease HI [Alphaproteobacteria bacterium]